MNNLRKIMALLLVTALLLTTAFATDMPPGEMPGGDMGGMPGGDMGGMPGGDMGGGPPGGMPGGGSTVSAQVTRCIEGPWSFTLTVSGEDRTVTITGWDKTVAGDVETILVPGYLGGGRVTAIASTAFSATRAKAVFLPDTVETVAQFAFYDLNSLQYISCANPNLSISGQALASCNNQEIRTTGDGYAVTVENAEAAAIAPGSYVTGEGWSISQSDLEGICAGTYSISGQKVTFTGDTYEPVSTTKPVELDSALKKELEEDDFRYTFRNLDSQETLDAFLDELNSGAFATVSLGLPGEIGYYLNGTQVELEEDCKAIDAATGEELAGIISTGAAYTYVAYADDDDNGKIDTLYYTNGTCDFIASQLDQSATVLWPDTLSDGKGSASSLAGKYLAFANGVLEASGAQDEQVYASVEISDTADGEITVDGAPTAADLVMASLNRERSILWADDYGSITVEYLNAVSSSSANWAQETFEAGDASFNYELNMQYGLNAGLYATNGGQITVGSLDGETSYIETYGDTGNGIISIGGGSDVGSKAAAYPTSRVYVYNTEFNCQGWNSHVADAIYGGYVYLEKVTGTTGIPGSYLGQSSALANDFGAGTIEAVDCDFTTYGNGSAGAYVIGQGSGTIKTTNTNFTSYLDSALCTAGGEFDITGGTAKGIIGFRARANGASSYLKDVHLIKADVDTNYANYYTDTGDGAALAAAQAWATATGDSGMPGPACSNLLTGLKGTTLGDLCDAYDMADSAKKTLYETLSDIAGESYDDNTLWRGSLLDSDRYGHPVASVGRIVTAGSDYSEAPYLNNGVGAEGLQTSAILEFQAAQMEVTLENCTVEYEGSGDYNYLIASESSGSAIVTFQDCADLTGVIWNEGDKSGSVAGELNLGNTDAGGMIGSSSTYGVDVTFANSQFAGSFADGSNGLWEVEGLSYTNSAGETSSLNGNYYGAVANWGNCANFDETSHWSVTGNSYLGSLTLAEGAVMEAQPGTLITGIYVDVLDALDVSTGTKVETLSAGTYNNVVILTEVDENYQPPEPSPEPTAEPSEEVATPEPSPVETPAPAEAPEVAQETGSSLAWIWAPVAAVIVVLGVVLFKKSKKKS